MGGTTLSMEYEIMNTVRILGALAIASSFAAPALAAQPRDTVYIVSSHYVGGLILCQVAAADAPTGVTGPRFCTLPSDDAHVVQDSHRK
jgi:hypothetical protein